MHRKPLQGLLVKLLLRRVLLWQLLHRLMLLLGMTQVLLEPLLNRYLLLLRCRLHLHMRIQLLQMHLHLLKHVARTGGVTTMMLEPLLHHRWLPHSSHGRRTGLGGGNRRSQRCRHLLHSRVRRCDHEVRLRNRSWQRRRLLLGRLNLSLLLLRLQRAPSEVLHQELLLCLDLFLLLPLLYGTDMLLLLL